MLLLAVHGSIIRQFPHRNRVLRPHVNKIGQNIRDVHVLNRGPLRVCQILHHELVQLRLRLLVRLGCNAARDDLLVLGLRAAQLPKGDELDLGVGVLQAVAQLHQIGHRDEPLRVAVGVDLDLLHLGLPGALDALELLLQAVELLLLEGEDPQALLPVNGLLHAPAEAGDAHLDVERDLLQVVQLNSRVDVREDEDRQQQHENQNKGDEAAVAALLAAPALLAELVPAEAGVHLRLAEVQVRVGVLELEPLENVERGGREGPVDVGLDLVEKRDRAVDFGLRLKNYS